MIFNGDPTTATVKELKALWGGVSINYAYQGESQDGVILLVGNAEGGYARIPISIKVDKAIVASATLTEEDADYRYNTLSRTNVLPTMLSVTFTEESDLAEQIFPVHAWSKEYELDRENQVYRTKATVGNAVSGYQEIVVELPLAEINLINVNTDGKSYAINAYDDITVDAEGRLLAEDGSLFTLTAEIGEKLYSELYVQLLTADGEPIVARDAKGNGVYSASYTALFADELKPVFKDGKGVINASKYLSLFDLSCNYNGGVYPILVAVGNDVHGYMTVSDVLTLTVKAQVVDKIYLGKDAKDILEQYGLTSEDAIDPYDLPFGEQDTTVRVKTATEEDIELPICEWSYSLASDEGLYMGGSATLKIVLGDGMHGKQTYLVQNIKIKRMRIKEIYVTENEKKVVIASSEEYKRLWIEDPLSYTLPTKVTALFVDESENELERELSVYYMVGNKNFKIDYQGGTFKVTAKVGRFNEPLTFGLVVNQKLVGGLAADALITIDPIEPDLSALLPTSLKLNIKGADPITVSTDDETNPMNNGNWTIVFKDGAYTFQATDKGDWDFSNVSLDYRG